MLETKIMVNTYTVGKSVVGASLCEQYRDSLLLSGVSREGRLQPHRNL